MTYKAMTKSGWLQKVADNNTSLRQLIADYHPSAHKTTKPMPITAPAAEAACQQIRAMIQNEETDDPVARWDKAVASGDISAIDSLLNSAWFGVPESISCWDIPGFSIAVDLMDDPPEQEEP